MAFFRETMVAVLSPMMDSLARKPGVGDAQVCASTERLLVVVSKACVDICHNEGEFSMSVFKACLDHALVDRPPPDDALPDHT